MSENNSHSSQFGTSLAGLTFLVFLVLKLTKVISWSWWWVTTPLWIPFGFVVIALLALLVIALLALLVIWLIAKRN